MMGALFGTEPTEWSRICFIRARACPCTESNNRAGRSPAPASPLEPPLEIPPRHYDVRRPAMWAVAREVDVIHRHQQRADLLRSHLVPNAHGAVAGEAGEDGVGGLLDAARAADVGQILGE